MRWMPSPKRLSCERRTCQCPPPSGAGAAYGSERRDQVSQHRMNIACFGDAACKKNTLCPQFQGFGDILPVLPPAPHRTRTFGLTALTAATVSETTDGSAVVTEMSPPMSSGGSTAMKVGFNAANALASSTSAAHAQTGKPSGNIATNAQRGPYPPCARHD